MSNLPDEIKQQLEKLWFFGNYEKPIIISAVIELSKDEIPSELAKDLAEIDGIKVEVRIERLNDKIIWKMAKIEALGYATSFAKKVDEIYEKTGGEKTYTPYEIVKDGKILNSKLFGVIVDILKDGVVYLTPYILPYEIEAVIYPDIKIQGIFSLPLISNALINHIKSVVSRPKKHRFLNYVRRVEDITKSYVSEDLLMYEDEQFRFELFGGGDQVIEGLIASIILHSEEKRKKIFLIEEPEIHLHPDYVRKLARVLEDLSRELDIQILITTHSPEFVGALQDWSVITVVRLDRVQTEELGSKPATKVYNLKERDRMAIEALAQTLGISPGIIAFTDVVILVEGRSDEIIFSKYVQILRQEQKLRNLSFYSWRFLDFASKGNLKAIINTLKEFDIFIAVIVDGDKKGEEYIESAKECGLIPNETAFQLKKSDILYYIDKDLLIKSLQMVIEPYLAKLEGGIKNRIEELIDKAKEKDEGLLAREGNETILRNIVSVLYDNLKQIDEQLAERYKEDGKNRLEHYLKTKIAELSIPKIDNVPSDIEDIFTTIDRQLERRSRT